jgi:hypothetical protein
LGIDGYHAEASAEKDEANDAVPREDSTGTSGSVHASTVLGRSLKKNASHADAPAKKRVKDTLQREQEGASHAVVIQLELEQQLEQKLEYRDYAAPRCFRSD